MFYKCELLIGGLGYSVTDDIKNWDDITATFKRNDYDGIVRSFSDKFEFVRGARVVLNNEYKTNYLKASASIVISTRNNSWTWTERFRCALDFSTLSDDGFTLSINAVDDSVASLIKAKKGTEYEYSVDVVKESVPLYYDGLQMKNKIDWIDGGVTDEENENQKVVDLWIEPYGDYIVPFPLHSFGEEIAVKNRCDFGDLSFDYYKSKEDVPYLFKALIDMTIHLKFKMQLYYTSVAEILLVKYSEGVSTVIKRQVVSSEWEEYSFDDNIELKNGEYLKVYFPFTTLARERMFIKGFEGFSIDFESRIDPVELDVIKSSVLLNRILKSMNGGKDGLEGVIIPSGEKRLDNSLILAGESARKIPNAKIYTSFSKFSQWMSAVYGYVYDINGKTVTFRPRKDYFADKKVKEVKNFTGYQMKVNSSLIYSQVNVGYEKQDYDSVNGKDEFRFTNIYNTGITMTDNKLELISPYRADAYGIEFLAQKIGEDTTDKSTDNSVFFVCANNGGDRYILDRTDTIQGVISPETMFNVMYSPTSMITANEPFLSGFITELSYASSEGNSAVEINGKPENRDISLSGGLFSVNEIDIETSDIDLPEDMTGYVEFEYQGEAKRGYIQSVDYHYTKTKSAKLTLVEKK